MKKDIEGELYNLTFNKKKIIHGFWLLIDDDGDEYIIQQNLYLFGFKKFNINRKVYKTTGSLVQYSVHGDELLKDTQKKSDFNYLGLVLIIPLMAFFRNIIPPSFLWGDSNLSGNILIGFGNLTIFWITLLFLLKITVLLRKYLLKKHLQALNMPFFEVGKGYSINPLQTTQKFLKWW